jgi:HrpA-like RNA helicase
VLDGKLLIATATIPNDNGYASTQGGKCYRIYCKEDFENMERETVPEIQRSNLLGVALHMKRVGIDDLLEFKFIDPPEPELIISAIKQLYLLDALTEDGKLTDIGRDMSELPVSPYLSRALIAAARDFNCSREMAMLAAMLSVENIFVEPRDEAKRKQAAKVQSQFHHPSGDHCTLINIYMAWKASDYSSSWCVDHFIRSHAMRSVRNIYNQLCDNMRRISLPIISTVASDTSKDTDTSAKHNEMNTFQVGHIFLLTAYNRSSLHHLSA